MVLTGSELSQHEHNIRTCFCMQYSTSSVCDLFRQAMYRNLLEGTCAIILPSAYLYHFQWLTTQEPSWPHARDRSIAEDSEHFADTWEHLRSVHVCMCVYVCLHACPCRTYVDNLYYIYRSDERLCTRCTMCTVYHIPSEQTQCISTPASCIDKLSQCIGYDIHTCIYTTTTTESLLVGRVT